jgi:hypothetical protein
VTALPKGIKFNVGYYTTEILEIIKNWWKGQGACSTRKLIVHADNARPHTTKLSMYFMDANRVTRDLHPPYLRDLGRCDFFLFGHVKRQLSGCHFDYADDLLTPVQEILDGFDKPTLIMVFEEWVRRLEQCIETKESTLDELKSASWFIWFGECRNSNACMGHPIVNERRRPKASDCHCYFSSKSQYNYF